MTSIFSLIGRLLIAHIFIVSGIFKIPGWHDTIAMMEREGLPAVQLLLAGGGGFRAARRPVRRSGLSDSLGRRRTRRFPHPYNPDLP